MLRVGPLWRMGGLWLALSTVLPAGDAVQLKVYDLGLTDLQTATEVVQGLLSGSGKLVADGQNHRLIVTDRPDVHERIAAALKQIRVRARNIRIAVTHGSERLEDRRRLEASGRGRVGDVQVGVGRNPPRRGAEVHGDASRSRSRSNTVQELLVLSGGKASIAVAERVPYPEWFWAWGQPYGLWVPGIAWNDVGTSLVVEPALLGDGKLRVRLTPAFSFFRDRERLVTEVSQLTTEVVVREGEEIDVGGIPISNREFLDRFLLGYDESGTTERVRITLRATTE